MNLLPREHIHTHTLAPAPRDALQSPARQRKRVCPCLLRDLPSFTLAELSAEQQQLLAISMEKGFLPQQTSGEASESRRMAARKDN